MMGKRGISPIVATVLMIVISIAAVILIMSVIVPFVKDSLGESSSCFDTIGELTFERDASCYSLDDDSVILRVRRGNVDIDGLYLSVTGDINFNDEVEELPDNGGGEHKYELFLSDYEVSFSGGERVDSASVGAVINGQRCDASDEMVLERC